MINNNSKKPLIAVCIPTRGTVRIEFAMGVIQSFGSIRETDWAFFDVKVCIESYSVALARNRLAKTALQAGADYLLWLDDDMLFRDGISPIQATKKLFDEQSDIVAGVYRTKQPGNPISAWDYSYADNWFREKIKSFPRIRKIPSIMSNKIDR